MAPIRAQLLKTATESVLRFNTGRSTDIVALRSPECRHEIAPASAASAAPFSNEAFAAWWDSFAPKLWPNGMDIWLDKEREPVIDELTRHVVLYAKARAESHKGIYEGSYVFNITVSADGERVDDVVEFLDSKSMLNYWTKVM